LARAGFGKAFLGRPLGEMLKKLEEEGEIVGIDSVEELLEG
jgi:hypothetical protein